MGKQRDPRGDQALQLLARKHLELDKRIARIENQRVVTIPRYDITEGTDSPPVTAVEGQVAQDVTTTTAHHYKDGVWHPMGGKWVLIDDVAIEETGIGQVDFDLTNHQDGIELRLIWVARSTLDGDSTSTYTDWLGLWYNDDFDTNYESWSMYDGDFYGGDGGAGWQLPAYLSIGYKADTSLNFGSPYTETIDSGEICITNYSIEDRFTNLRGLSILNDEDLNHAPYTIQGSGIYFNTGAVTKLSVGMYYGPEFEVGSRFTLYKVIP